LPVAFDIGREAFDDPRQRRIALNQAILRRLNEAMHADAGRRVAFRCECGQLGCNQLIALRVEQYEAVRAHARRFAVVAGHEVDEIDETVERHEDHVVVEARPPAAAALAEQTNPRSRHE
jgi:hypothetical protein